jgi:hypothetical protein
MAQAASGPFSPPPSRRVSNPLSRTAVETAVARVAAGFGVAFLLQSLPAMLSQQSALNPLYYFTTVIAMVAALAFTVVTSIVRRWVRAANVIFCLVYLVFLVSWPFAAADPHHPPNDSPWIYYLLTIATAMAAIGFGIRTAVVYLILVPAIYAVVRVTPAGGHTTVLLAIANSAYSVILGAIITIIFTILRYTARSVDGAQEMALDRYSYAVRQHAIEAERVQVDAIVHDSVLTTFISAARAFTPEARALATTMAGNAIGYLHDAVTTNPNIDATVSGTVVATRIAEAAGTMSRPFAVKTITPGRGSMPTSVAEAMTSAAVQGMVNSLQHAGAGDVERWVTVRGLDDGGMEVEIGDRGEGFDPAVISDERLGVRVSIIERLAMAGGRAQIDTRPGEGTVIRLHWPESLPAVAPEFAGLAADDELDRLEHLTEGERS